MKLRRPRVWSILHHRFVAVPLDLAVAAGTWNLYVASNNGGVIAGTVQDPAGRPVVGAPMLFFQRTCLTTSNIAAPAPAPLGTRQLRLWFRAQTTLVSAMIVR